MREEYPSGLSVERATVDDLTDVQTILTDRCKWLSHRRITQWPGGGFPTQLIERSINNESVYIVRVGKEIVGTVTIVDEDEMWRDDESALHVRRLATHSSWGGRDIGGAILAWILERAAFDEKKYVRVACPAGNERLTSYFANKQFELVDTVEFEGTDHALLQRTAL